MPLRLYKEGEIVVINELDSPVFIIGDVSKGQLHVKEDKETWFDKEGYPPNLILKLSTVVMTMPEHLWLAIGEFEDERTRNVVGQS